MSLPEIPEEKFRPSFCEVMIDLLESIALEEISLSHLMNAEAEKVQTFVGKHHDLQARPKIHEVIRFNKTVNQFLETVVMKEWLLLRKLENVMEVNVECEICEEEE